MFRFYVVNFGSYNQTYGAIGGAMVLLTWLYLTGPLIVIGAEMNAKIEHASAHGKAAGEKRFPHRSPDELSWPEGAVDVASML